MELRAAEVYPEEVYVYSNVGRNSQCYLSIQ